MTVNIPDERRAELAGGVATMGGGVFVKHLGDHERFPYEVEIEVGLTGKFTYALDELSPAYP